MSPAPILFTWEGDAMRPTSAMAARAADRQYTIGETYRLDVVEERSTKSHAHFFAQVHELWDTLPEDMSERFPSPEHLRHYCLIRAGFCDTSTIVASSKAEAAKIAAFIRPMDEFAIVTVRENVVTRFVARSQSYRAMPKGEFQKSKDAVFDQIAILLGTKRQEAA